MNPRTSLKIGIALSLAVVALFMMSSMAAPMTSGSIQAQALTSKAFNQPEPFMQTNVTWQDFNSSMHYNEYLNATDKPAYLNAVAGAGNYISINPADIQIRDAQKNFMNFSKYSVGNGNPAGFTSSKVNENEYTATDAEGQHFLFQKTSSGIEYIVNSSKATTTGTTWGISIPITDLPSSNPAYDYFTIIGNTSGKQITGESAIFFVENSTNHASYGNPFFTIGETYGNGEIFSSTSLAKIIQTKGVGNMNISKNTKYRIGMKISIPEYASTAFSMQIKALEITSYPIYLGENATGSKISEANGIAHLSQFDPAVPMNITSNGYSESLVQPFSSLPKSQITSSPLSQSKYIEQVTYQGNFEFPSAPGISYSATSLKENLSVPSTQIPVLDINGVSYLTTISGQNGTVVLVSAVNPNTNTSLLQITDYTSSQWDSISGPPGFFSVAGIEYYFDEIVLGIIALVGVGGGAAAMKTSQLRRVK